MGDTPQPPPPDAPLPRDYSLDSPSLLLPRRSEGNECVLKQSTTRIRLSQSLSQLQVPGRLALARFNFL